MVAYRQYRNFECHSERPISDPFVWDTTKVSQGIGESYSIDTLCRRLLFPLVFPSRDHALSARYLGNVTMQIRRCKLSSVFGST